MVAGVQGLNLESALCMNCVLLYRLNYFYASSNSAGSGAASSAGSGAAGVASPSASAVWQTTTSLLVRALTGLK